MTVDRQIGKYFVAQIGWFDMARSVWVNTLILGILSKSILILIHSFGKVFKLYHPSMLFVFSIRPVMSS